MPEHSTVVLGRARNRIYVTRLLYVPALIHASCIIVSGASCLLECMFHAFLFLACALLLVMLSSCPVSFHALACFMNLSCCLFWLKGPNGILCFSHPAHPFFWTCSRVVLLSTDSRWVDSIAHCVYYGFLMGLSSTPLSESTLHFRPLRCRRWERFLENWVLPHGRSRGAAMGRSQ